MKKLLSWERKFKRDFYACTERKMRRQKGHMKHPWSGWREVQEAVCGRDQRQTQRDEKREKGGRNILQEIEKERRVILRTWPWKIKTEKTVVQRNALAHLGPMCKDIYIYILHNIYMCVCVCAHVCVCVSGYMGVLLIFRHISFLLIHVSPHS